VQNCRDELNLLLHTLRQIGDLPHPPVGEAESIEPGACLLTRDTPRHTLRFREKDQYVEHTHLRVQPALLGEVPDVRGMLPTPTDLAEEAHDARVWLVDIHDHADRRRLAGAVGAEQTVNDAGGNAERERVDGGVTGEALRDAIDDNRISHAPKLEAKGLMD